MPASISACSTLRPLGRVVTAGSFPFLASARHLLKGKHRRACDVADDGKRNAIESKQQQQRAHTAIGQSATKRLHVGAELRETERMFRIEQSKADCQGNRCDERSNTIEGSIHGGEGKTQSALAPRQILLTDTCSLPQAEENGAMPMRTNDAPTRTESSNPA